ncbi:hypothetical protein HUK80_10950 [Flavobacterium sp. MAH-1]|uniref:Uncharacterized protein n=1 Tax=Flavobacterium agri TaxID=2743471 RepID=A0A7Y8Y309_9FLAO|nr:hypothetical protein [Flavobacterium agri]NUY81416.1 hypothetical protein [Flavobacterium agri]NYA71440.1 hypothetical protein [Flavobacterium agri]
MFKKLIYLPKNFAKKIFYLLLRPMKFVPKTTLAIQSKALLSLALTMVSGISLAAPNEPPPPSPGPVPPGTPIDNGVILLVICAVVFGFYKIHQIKNKKAQM